MDRFDTMLAFTRVVELASFTKAAHSLNLPKTTVSAQVVALEKRLAVKLLNRTTRHVSVTTDGAAYYERAIRLLNELDDTEASVRQFTTKPKGRLRIDLPASLGRQVVMPAIKEFFDRYPEIELEIGCSDRPVDLLQEGVDCVIRGGELLDQSMVARRIGSIRIVSCATPDYLRKAGIPQTPEDIERHSTINYMSSKTGKIYEFDYSKDGITSLVTGQRSIAINDTDASLAAGLAGVGIMQTASFLVQDLIATGKLEIVLGEYLSEDVPIFVMYPQNRHLSSKVRAFVDWVAELFANSDLLQSRTTLR
ncbi:LysR family transcriptional regulator [Methyloradius palustris]|uniref:LysR family transcriptional regulator n=1 Tax=Methyloradius palustris TaxID=2778876 RepID=A0A8D5G6K6_9PROT|nr:LysR family transcriptional regulator [Methyloradius palustris]BCM24216.1 LysR family transcriptional regulator [Methyloradius palustris]